MNYFVINKQMDYNRGYLEGCEYRDGKLCLTADTQVSGCFLSRLFDSREEENVWHRFTVKGVSSAGAGFQAGFYTFDSPVIAYEGRKIRLEEFFRDPETGLEEKKRVLAPYLRLHSIGRTDILLHQARGRYMMVMVELYRQETEIRAGDMCLYFPAESWLRYLPGIYGKDPESRDFTERFLGIFQSLYDDRTEEIRTSAEMISPEAAGRKLLEELASFYDLRDIWLWPDDKLRELVKCAPRIMAKRGTAGGLKDYLKLYIGEEPVIEEDPADRFSFTVYVPESYIDDVREYRSLIRIIGHMKPAGMSVRVKPKVKRDRAGEEMYLGISSRLFGEEDNGGTA